MGQVIHVDFDLGKVIHRGVVAPAVTKWSCSLCLNHYEHVAGDPDNIRLIQGGSVGQVVICEVCIEESSCILKTMEDTV